MTKIAQFGGTTVMSRYIINTIIIVIDTTKLQDLEEELV